jgi:uncharacterized NAD(P)/FAD-binding protein YdhS
MDRVDLAFVGGGVSSAAVLEALVELALSGPCPLRERAATAGRPLRLLVLDQAGEFGGGVPYGRSVPPGYLCNDPAGKQHPAAFTTWLHERRPEWVGSLRESGDPGARRWLALNAGPLAAADRDPRGYDGLFVPRAVYGSFARERLAGTLTAAHADGSLDISLRRERVVGLVASGPSFRLDLQGGGAVASGLVVLAIGSPPPRPEPELEGESGYVRAPCSTDLDRLEAVLGRALDDSPPAVVAILGGNACALETMWLLDTRPALRRRLARAECVTPGGMLPDASRSGHAATPDLAALAALDREQALTADALFAAVRDDVGRARAEGFTSLDYADPLYARFVPLLARLGPDERRRLAETYGRRLKALARHCPPEYRQAAAGLAADGILRVVPGRVRLVRAARPGLRVLWRDAAGAEHTLAASVVLDCRGWGYLDEAHDPLLASLLAHDTGPARPNGSRIGLAVDEEFQAAPGLFITGPLLAGCSNGRHTIWNLENARRIHALAPALARSLARRLAAPPGATPEA